MNHAQGRSRAFVLVTALTVVASPVASPAAPQERSAAQFETAVEVFHIQVSVLDAQGAFVDGLRPEDFEVRIDGEPRRLVNAYPVDARTLEPGPVESDRPLPESGDAIVGPVVDSGAPSVSRRRFLLFVDLWNLTRRGLVNARRAARQFLEDIARPADLVGLAISSPRFGLMYRVPFTVRHEAVAEALEELGAGRALEVPEGVLPGVPLEAVVEGVEGIGALADGADLPAWAREVAELRVEASAEAFLEHLGLLAADLASIQGRKHVLVFSHGLPDAAVDPLRGGGDNMVVERLESSAATARASGVVLHTLQPENMGTPSINDVRNMQSAWSHPDPAVGGLGALGAQQATAAALMDRLSIINDRAVLRFLAGETGGESSWFRHNLDEGAEAVEAASRRYYVLALPVRPDEPDEVRLDVRVRRSGAVVRGAPERLAVPRGVEVRGGVEGDFRVAEALEIGVDASNMELDLVPVPLSHAAGVGRLALFATIPAAQVRALQAARDDGAPELEVLGLALTRWGTVVDHFRGRIRPQAPEGAGGSGPLRYYNLLVVPPGRYHVKLMMREPEVGAFVSRSLQLQVPSAPPRGLAVAVSPLSVGEIGPADLVSGVDPADPPEHRRGRPLGYPLRVGDVTVAPTPDEVLRPGDSRLLFLRVRGLARHPFTGESAPGFRVRLSSGEHGERPVPEAEALGADVDGDGVLSLLLRVRLPEDLPAGSHELRIEIRDGVAGRTVQATATLAVASG